MAVMRRSLLPALFCLSFTLVQAQTETNALPSHNGAMLLNLDGLHVTQRSARPMGREVGVRAHDSGNMQLLAFLFLTPENKKQTPGTCLQQDLKQIRKDNGRLVEQPNPLGKDTSGFATILLTYPNGNQSLYKYAGTGDQCLLVEVSADKGSKLDISLASALLDHLTYDPSYSPTQGDAARYQGIAGGAIIASKPKPVTTPRMLVSWHTPGGIPLPTDAEWKIELLTAYEHAGRPTAEFHSAKTNVIASFIISENVTGKPTAESCRKDVIEAILKNEGRLISDQVDGEMSDGRGGLFATSSHHTALSASEYNHDFFAFAANAKTCAEIHVSTVSGKPDEEERLADAVAEFHPDLLYKPTCADYLAEASTFYKESPMMAAPFYDSCLNTIPTDAKDTDSMTTRRLATDQIVIALGMNGDLRRSRAYAERAIKIDPDYPLNYYNLACADAEQGKADDARKHLQQAFDRKANTLLGEHLPNPTQDDSIQKLRNDKAFWSFVQTLK